MSEAETEEVVAAMIEAAAAGTAKMEVATETAVVAVMAKMAIATETATVVMGNAAADSNDGGNSGS
jgi:hypothetical protein